MPTELLTSGIPTSVLQNTVYALPAGSSYIDSSLGLEVSNDGTSWAALSKNVSAKKFIRCTAGNAIILARSLGIRGTETYEIYGARSYQDTIKADGAVAYWPLDDPSGTTAFDKIGTRHGTISGGVTLNQTGVNNSKCMTFDGSTGKISLPSITLPAISSVEAWYKSTYNSFHVIWTNRTSAISTNSYLQGSSGVAGRPQFKCGASVADSTASILTNDGQWHHVVGISTGSKTQVFVDGVVGADFTTPGTATTGVGYIGFDDFSNGPMTLQDIAIYNRALTPADVQSHYTKRLE